MGCSGATVLLLVAAWVQQGAAVTCNCDTPGAGTAGHNRFSCTDGSSAHCAADELCFATSRFEKGEWASGCRREVQSGIAGGKCDAAVSDEHRRELVKACPVTALPLHCTMLLLPLD